MNKLRRQNRNGFSLLEVILAVAILGGSMVIIGHGFFNGYRSVRNARMIGMGNRFADSAMNELAAGAVDATSVSNQPIPNQPNWTYSMEIEDASVPGLLAATVIVENTEFQPNTRVSIARLIPDPDFDPLTVEE